MSFLLYTNLFVALCAASLVTATRLLIGDIPTPGWLELHVFFATLTVYNIDRLVDGDEDQVNASDRHLWIASHRPLLWIVTGIAAVGTIVSMALLPLDVVIGLVPLAVISFLYSVPILGRNLRLKSVPGAKTFVIATVWAVVTVLLPALAFDGSIRPWLLAERFVFVFAITLPFELRDIRRDAAVGIRSIAHVLGARGTVWTAVALLIVFSLSSALHFAEAPRFAGALVVSGLTTAGLVTLSRRPRSDLYYSFFLDGTMLAQSLLLLVAFTFFGIV